MEQQGGGQACIRDLAAPGSTDPDSGPGQQSHVAALRTAQTEEAQHGLQETLKRVLVHLPEYPDHEECISIDKVLDSDRHSAAQ